MPYTISLDYAQPVSLDSLNVTSAVLKENISGEVTLTLTCSQDFNTPDIAPPFSEAVLYDENNTRRFIGWLDKAPRDATADSQSVTYTFNGGWRWFERNYYTQNRAGLVILGGAAGSATTAPAQLFSDVYISIMQSAGFYFDYQPQWQIDNLYYIEVPTRPRSDVTCADALLTLLQFAPTACLRWTYATSSPKLNLIKADETIDAYINSNTHKLVSAGLTPRYDLLADSIIVYFMRDDAVVGYDTWGPQYGQGTGGDAGALGANKKTVITYDVSVINNIPAIGLAQTMASWHQRLHIDGEVEKQEINWSDYAGQLLGFSGSLFTPFSPYKTLLTELSRDLYRGTTTMSLGVYPARIIYKVGDYDTPAPSSPQVYNNQPWSAPSSGISYGAPNNSTFNSDGFSTNGSGNFGSVDANIGDFGQLDAQDATFDTLTVTDTSTLQGVVTASATPIAIEATGTIKANASTGDAIEAAGKVKATQFEATDANAPIIVNGVSYKELQIERCDGKKVKILADSAGWA